MPRRKILDDQKRGEIVALVTAGMQLHKVASYVGCSTKTIARERKQNSEFEQQMRRAHLAADLNPLEAMRRAAGTHWRAAAWMLDRDDRRQSRTERAQKAKRQKRAEQKEQADANDAPLAGDPPSRRELAALLTQVVRAVNRELADPLLAMRVETRVEDVFRQTLSDLANPTQPVASSPANTTDLAASEPAWNNSIRYLANRYPPGKESDPPPAAAEP